MTRLGSLALALALTSGIGLSAQTPTPASPAAAPAAAPVRPAVPFPGDAKVGLVNMQDVLASSKLGQSGQAAIKAENDKWNGMLQGMATRLQGLQQEYQAQQTTLSATAAAQKRAELDKLQREAQFQQSQRDAEIQTLSERLSKDFDEKVMPILETLRSERNLWFVLDSTDSQLAAVNTGLDLTAEVVKRLDALK